MESRSPVFKVLLLVLVVAVIAIIYSFLTSQWRDTKTGTGPDKSDLFNNVSGYVYYSDDEEETRRSVMKAYNVKDGTTQVLTTDSLAYDQYPIIILDPDTNTPALLYVQTAFDPTSNTLYPYSQYRQVMKRNLGNGEETQIGVSRIGNRVGLVWSQAAEKFAFIGLAPEVLARRDAGEVTGEDLSRLDSSVYVSDLKGNVTEIARGTSPSWSSDGKSLYYLGLDGVFVYDLKTENIDTVLRKENWQFSFFSGFTVTENERYIVWTDPLNKSVHIWEKQGTEGQVYVYVESFTAPDDKQPVTPPVSVDDATIMYLAVTDDGDESTVVFLDIQTGEQTELFTIDTEKHYYAHPSWGTASP